MMKKNLKNFILLGCLLGCIIPTLMMQPARAAVEDYVGIKVGENYGFTATFKYKVNDSEMLTANLDFKLTINEILNETNAIFYFYSPVNITIEGKMTGDNVTQTPLNTTLPIITGAGMNASYKWDEEKNSIISNSLFPLGIFNLGWAINQYYSDTYYKMVSKTEFEKMTQISSWNGKGVLASYNTVYEFNNDTSGEYEYQYVQVTLKQDNYTIWIVAGVSGAVAAVVVIGYLYKKGKIGKRI